MCDKATETILEKIISKKMETSDMFTAFDISKEAQRNGVKERHRNLKADIHRIANDLLSVHGYEKIIINIPNISGNPFLYHKYGEDTSQYGPLRDISVASIQPPTQNIGQSVRNTDKRGTVAIPSSLIVSLGMKVGDKAGIILDDINRRLEVIKLISGMIVDKSYTVDKSNNIRITQSTLDKAKIKNLSSINIKLNNNKIIIE